MLVFCQLLFILTLGIAGSASGQMIALGIHERKPFKVLISFGLCVLLCISAWFLPIFK